MATDLWGKRQKDRKTEIPNLKIKIHKEFQNNAFSHIDSSQIKKSAWRVTEIRRD
jgi:hypothetical protein